MGDALFHILAIVVAVVAVVRGYRAGMTGMITSVLGMAFGIICAHIFLEVETGAVEDMLPEHLRLSGGSYLAGNIGAGIVFFAVYLLFKSITGIIRKAMEQQYTGLLNSLLGSGFCIVNYLLMLSVCYNIWVGMNPTSALMRYGRADDGNIVCGVLAIAPACLGTESFADFAHRCQLEDARKISCNLCDPSVNIFCEMGS